MSAADPLSPVRYEVEPPWIGLVGPEHPTDAGSDGDLGIWGRGQHLELLAMFLKPNQFVQCSRAHYPQKEAAAIREYHCH